jgi:hypothetical protein
MSRQNFSKGQRDSFSRRDLDMNYVPVHERPFDWGSPK